MSAVWQRERMEAITVVIILAYVVDDGVFWLFWPLTYVWLWALMEKLSKISHYIFILEHESFYIMSRESVDFGLSLLIHWQLLLGGKLELEQSQVSHVGEGVWCWKTRNTHWPQADVSKSLLKMCLKQKTYHEIVVSLQRSTSPPAERTCILQINWTMETLADFWDNSWTASEQTLLSTCKETSL